MMQPSPNAAYTALSAGGLYTYPGQQLPPQMQPQHPMIAAAAHPQAHQMASLPPQAFTHLQQPRMSPYGAHPYQPIMYWYPSPPVSPQSSYYMHSSTTTVAVKGLPFNVTAPEILALFDGIFEVSIGKHGLIKHLQDIYLYNLVSDYLGISGISFMLKLYGI